MRGHSVWQRWSGILATATERDFERKVLPFLRLFWPSLHQVPARGPWDAKGIDLLVWTDSGHFPCAIQCKGFLVNELGKEQIRQIESSIEAFLRSDLSCDTYLIVHNRDGRFKEFNSRVTRQLKNIVSRGKAKKAELWDRQLLLRNAFGRLRDSVNEALREHSQELLRYFQGLLEFGQYYLPTVPVIEKILIFKRGQPCTCRQVHPVYSRDTRKLLFSPSKTRWTLLAGRFGTGKTTAVLHAATSADRVAVFVRCAELPSDYLMTSTNMLLEEIVKSLKILDDFEDQDRVVLNEVAGPVLGNLLRQPKSPHFLILDGLDENRHYSNLKGLQYLNNQLAELNCPIIMTTRLEHLNAMFGDFSMAFHELSTKKGPRRNARLLELDKWEIQQVRGLLSQVGKEMKGVKKERLSRFVQLFDGEEYVRLYGNLPFNPLFLQFILEDVVSVGLRRASRSMLIRSWAERKIRRDRESVERVSVGEGSDTEDFVGRMIHLMENVANCMTYEVAGRTELSEHIPASLVREEAQKVFGRSSDPVLGVLLNSLLVPQSFRRRSDLNVAFSFKILHEYFLASYLIRSNQSIDGFPDAVREFCLEGARGSG